MNLEKMQFTTLSHDKCSKATINMVTRRLVLQASELSNPFSCSGMKLHMESGRDYDLTVARYGKKAIAASIAYSYHYSPHKKVIEIYVSPRQRRKGVGRKVLNYVTSYYLQLGFEVFETKPWNAVSTAFYQDFYTDIIPSLQKQLATA